MLLNLHAKVMIGFIEVFLLTHAAALDVHNRLLAPHPLLKLGCKLDHFKLSFVTDVFKVSFFEYAFN